MKRGSLDSLNCRTRCGWSPCARQMRWTEEMLTPAGRLGHRRAGPVRLFARRRFHGERDDTFGERRIELGDARGPRLIVQKSVHAFGSEALLPAPDASLRLAGLSPDRVRPEPFGAEPHDLRPPHGLLRRVAVLDQSSEPIDIGGRVTEREMPGLMPQTRTPRVRQESPPGSKCQILSTRVTI